MNVTMVESIKWWTAKRKTALVIEIIQSKTTVAEASRAYDLSPSEIEAWVEDAKRGMVRTRCSASSTSKAGKCESVPSACAPASRPEA